MLVVQIILNILIDKSASPCKHLTILLLSTESHCVAHSVLGSRLASSLGFLGAKITCGQSPHPVSVSKHWKCHPPPPPFPAQEDC